MGTPHETREAREARFRSWWDGLSPEAQRAEIKAGHVRLNLPAVAEKPPKRRKRTRAAQARSAEVKLERIVFGESYVHSTPLQRFGMRLRAAVAKRDAARDAA